MNETAAEQGYDPITALSRSLFGFALIAWLPLFITFVSLLLAQSSPEASYAQLQRSIVIAFGAVTLLALLGLVWIFRLETPSSLRIATTLVYLLDRRRLSILLLIVLVELNILAQILTSDIAPSVTNPAKFLLFFWTILSIGSLMAVHWQAIKKAYMRRRDAWAMCGMALAALSVIVLMVVLNSRLVTASGLHDRLRGSLDYRPLRFVDAEGAPTAQEFWAEQGQVRVRWLPYSYWVLAPFDGQFINVDKTGLRETTSFVKGANRSRVYFFGGSTIWGEGARDAYTIPSQVARLLNKREVDALVQNYGQTGYVSTQDLILFQRQLALGYLPDIAVFYHGFNDVFSARLQEGMAGLPLRESQRIDDVEAGRLLRQGQPVLTLPSNSLAQVDWTLVAAASYSAQPIIDNWLANRRLIQATAIEFDVQVLFVWQPALFAKESLTDFEARIATDFERDLPGFTALYQEVDSQLRQRATSEAWDDVIILSDLFSESDEEVFFDKVHINELGNQQVAASIADAIAERLNND